MRYLVERSYLVRHIDVWEVTTDTDDTNPNHMLAEHYDEFDRDLTNGGDPLGGWTSEQKSAGTEPVEYDERHLAVIDRAPANVIPIGRNRKS